MSYPTSKIEPGLPKVWQRGHYEHIPRDQADHERRAGYISSNPAAWEKNEEKIAEIRED
jgi:hypothetical protein